MALPARKLPEENHSPDRQQPHLRGLPGGGEGGPAPGGYPRPHAVPDAGGDEDKKSGYQGLPAEDRPVTRPNLRQAEQNSLYNPRGDEGKTKGGKGGKDSRAKSDSPTDLNDSEQAASDDENARNLYNPGGRGNRRTGVKGFAKKHKKKLLFGGAGLGGGLISIFIMLFMLVPLKLEHMMSNLHNRFFSSSEQAMQSATRVLLARYVVKHVLPDYKNCDSTISRKCKVSIISSNGNPVTNVYRGWAQSRLENRLADNGIEFYRSGIGRNKVWHLRIDGSSAKDFSIGKNGEKLEGLLKTKNRREIIRAVDKGLGDQTLWKRYWMRYKVGRLLATKYGIKRCLVFCGTRNQVKKTVAQKELTAKLYLAERVLKPRSELHYLAVVCIMTPSCHPDEVKPSVCEGATDCDPPESDYEKEQRKKLGELAERYGYTNITELEKTHKDMADRGFFKFTTERILQKFGLTSVASKKVADAIPVIGWINLAAQATEAADNAGPKIKKLSYLTNGAAAAGLFMMYTSYADEVHTGEVDALEAGSMADSLGRGIPDANGEPTGGVASAEEAPLYDQVMSGGGPRGDAASLLASFLPGRALAAEAEAGSQNYKCKNGKTPQSGAVVCNEDKLGTGNGVANTFHDILGLPGISAIVTIAKAWNDIVGPIFNAIGDVISFLAGPLVDGATAPLNASCKIGDAGTGIGISLNPVPGGDAYCAAKGLVEEYAPKIMEIVTEYLIPNGFGDNMGGGRVFTLAAAGANVGGNDACVQIGCRKAKNEQELASIVFGAEQNRREEFAQRPLMARMFDTESSYSLVSQLAIATPFNTQADLQRGAASLFLNPFASLAGGFGSVFSSPRASAADVEVNPFNADMMVFPDSEIPDDMEAYWDTHKCADPDGPIKQWQQKAADAPKSELTGMPEYDTVEPCQLIKTVTGANGAADDKDNLTPRDLGEIPGEGQTTSGGTEAAGETIDVANLTKPSEDVECAPNTKDLGVEDGYSEGTKIRIRICAVSNLPSSGEESNDGYGVSGAGGKAVVNSRVSGALYKMVEAAKKDDIPMSANSSFRTMSHQQSLCNSNASCAAGNYTFVARPGTSNHQLGVAIDFAMANPSRFPLSSEACVDINGRCSAPGDKVWEWLDKNADKFGFKPYVNEFWHWSPTGH